MWDTTSNSAYWTSSSNPSLSLTAAFPSPQYTLKIRCARSGDYDVGSSKCRCDKCLRYRPPDRDETWNQRTSSIIQVHILHPVYSLQSQKFCRRMASCVDNSEQTNTAVALSSCDSLPAAMSTQANLPSHGHGTQVSISYSTQARSPAQRLEPISSSESSCAQYSY